jgi:hypothetical protein
MSGWTSSSREQIELAERLWNEGKLSARQIGAKVGMSHNAVIGHAHRRGWAKRGSPIGVTRPKSSVPTKAAKAHRVVVARSAPSVRPVIDWSAILAADPRGCQWIEADALVDPTPCGVPSVPGCSWCAEHRLRVFSSAEHPAAFAPALDALPAVGRPSNKRSGSLRGDHISTGAEIRALKQEVGEIAVSPVRQSCELLSEPVVVHGSHHGAADAREVGEVVQRNGWHG